jgi:hypothetical protein
MRILASMHQACLLSTQQLDTAKDKILMASPKNKFYATLAYMQMPKLTRLLFIAVAHAPDSFNDVSLGFQFFAQARNHDINASVRYGIIISMYGIHNLVA